MGIPYPHPTSPHVKFEIQNFKELPRCIQKSNISTSCCTVSHPLLCSIPSPCACFLLQLEELMLCGYTRPILYAIPQQWSCLMRLTSLELTTTKSFS